MCQLDIIRWTCGDWQVARRLATCSNPRPRKWECVTEHTDHWVSHDCHVCRRVRTQSKKFHSRNCRVPVVYKDTDGEEEWLDEDTVKHFDVDIKLLERQEIVLNGNRTLFGFKLGDFDDDGYDTDFSAREKPEKKVSEKSQNVKANDGRPMPWDRTVDWFDFYQQEIGEQERTIRKAEASGENSNNEISLAWWTKTRSPVDHLEITTMEIDDPDDFFHKV